MSTNYAGFVQRLVERMGGMKQDLNLTIVVPAVIDYAEQRIYRDLDLLSMVVRDATGVLTVNSRNFTFPQHFVVCESLNVFTGVGITVTGRKPLIPTSREFMDAVYPDETAGGCCDPAVPEYYAMVTDQKIIVGPSPDAAYTVEVVGTVRPTPLSPTNSTSYLTTHLPDLLLAGAMIYGSGYGISPVPPQGAPTWEAEYQSLLASANIEENRKKYASQAWTSKQPAPLATPPRV